MRIRYFDIAKGIGMVLVVLSHTCPMGIGIQGFCESFHMPMFFFISGYFFSLDKYSLKDFFKRRFLQLVLPLVSFSILVGTLNSFSQTCFKISNYMLPDTLWFLWVLFVVELLFMYLMRAYGGIISYCIIALTVYVSSKLVDFHFDDPLYLQASGNALLFYSLGNLFAIKGLPTLIPSRRDKSLFYRYVAIWGGYFLIFIMSFVGLITTEISNNIMSPTIPALIVAIIGILLTISLSDIIDAYTTKIGNLVKGILDWIGKHTIVIMALHLACWRMCVHLQLSSHFVLSFVLSQIIMWGICASCAFIFDKKYFRFFVGKINV